jgi:hypothetical protein
MLVPCYKSTRCNNPEDRYMNLRGSENLSNHFLLFVGPQKNIHSNIEVKTAWRFTSEPLLRLHGVMLTLQSRYRAVISSPLVPLWNSLQTVPTKIICIFQKKNNRWQQNWRQHTKLSSVGFITLKTKPSLKTWCLFLSLHVMTINVELYHSHATAMVHTWRATMEIFACFKNTVPSSPAATHNTWILSIYQYLQGLLWDAISKNMQYYSSYERPKCFKTEIATGLLWCIRFICYVKNWSRLICAYGSQNVFRW